MKGVILYSKSGCKDSDKIKQVLNSSKIHYMEKDISGDALLMREMIERSGGKTAAPQIFVDGRRDTQTNQP